MYTDFNASFMLKYEWKLAPTPSSPPLSLVSLALPLQLCPVSRFHRDHISIKDKASKNVLAYTGFIASSSTMLKCERKPALVDVSLGSLLIISVQKGQPYNLLKNGIQLRSVCLKQ